MSFIFATAAVALAVLGVTPAHARQEYQSRIPNGANVPDHPGVGHIATGGGGARNAFGLAFAAANLTWTSALCQADTDGDGFSNGAELGDPDCSWTVGTTPSRTVGISDPSLASSTPESVSSAASPVSLVVLFAFVLAALLANIAA